MEKSNLPEKYQRTFRERGAIGMKTGRLGKFSDLPATLICGDEVMRNCLRISTKKQEMEKSGKDIISIGIKF